MTPKIQLTDDLNYPSILIKNNGSHKISIFFSLEISFSFPRSLYKWNHTLYTPSGGCQWRHRLSGMGHEGTICTLTDFGLYLLELIELHH